ncbi:acetolactate synthase large subunit [Salidesulfovibrio brasiliensis]|uniref:acetolactate synthase large subunit n=1 Tax=Salidesulfovibrio brasiliensis TaxID=221711 RepID=UPI0006D2C142|nr:acetolactate synthase large subunit [Salidesulfovibrio brasiliensis]
MPSMTGAELLIRLLERQKIKTIAGIPGGTNLPIYDALGRSERIRHVLARHEQGAAFMAQGMARSTGRPAVCMATSGPGATNLLTAVADAKLDSIPIICITGQVPLSLIGTDAFQEMDIYGMSIPVTKHNYLVRSAQELLHVVPEAFRIAASGRPGPVLIDIPKDVQCQTIDVPRLPAPGEPEAAPDMDREAIDKAARMIDHAKRPILYLGGGVTQSDCAGIATRLAEKGSLPSTMTLMGLGALPHDHPLSLGMLGMHAAKHTNMALEECDLLIAAGVRFDDRATGRLEGFCPDADIIHIDIDPGELGKLKTDCVGITADVTSALGALLDSISTQDRSGWLSRIGELKKQYPALLPGTDDPTSPYGLVSATAALLGPDAIVTTDVGQHQMRAAQAYPVTRPRQFLTSGGLGTMGFGIPAAIGAALAHPDRTVVCFTGDGSMLMNIQELATAAEQQLNIKIILADNGALGLVQQQQELFYEDRKFASSYANRIDFTTIAKGFGIEAVDLADCDSPMAVMTKAMRSTGPALIRIPVQAADNVYPMVPPGAANSTMIEGASNA